MATPEPSLENLRETILEQIDEFLAIARDESPWTTAPTPFSAWPPLTHAEHMARAGLGSVGQLDKAIERDGGPGIHFLGRLVLLLGWLPRGLGQAPPSTTPRQVDRTEVAAMFEDLRVRVESLDLERIARARGRAHHPAFGGLTARQWFRFLDIHHRHHLRIVHDQRPRLGP
jgi:hypothetical protein